MPIFFKRSFGIFLAIIAFSISALCISLIMQPMTKAYAETSVHASEGWTLSGSCEWQIDTKTHTMTVRPAGNGSSGSLSYSEPWKSTSAVIDKIVFQGRIILNDTSTSFMFSGMNNLLEIQGAGNLDTSNISSTDFMFCGAPSLEKIDLKGFDTSNVTSMDHMFSGCYSLETLDLSSFDTSNVTDMSNMFFNCSYLKSVNLSKLNTSRVLNMSGMFWGCTSIKSLNLSAFNTTRTTNMSYIFSGCSSLETLDISNFDTSRVSSSSSAFSQCSSLYSIKVGDKFTLQSELPKGAWKDSRGYIYNDTIPTGVPGTFTYYGNVPSVSISASSKTLKLSGSQVTLTAKANVSTGTWLGSIKWTSSNPKVASVDSKGVVTPQGIGTATITATADRATAKCAITVNPDSATMSKLVQSKKAFTIKWKKPSSKTLKQITGYKIRYSTAKTMKKSTTKTVKATSASGKKCSLKIAKLKAKKKYYVQICTYKKVGSKTYQSAWSKAKTVKTK